MRNVYGFSAPRTCCCTGSSLVNWSRALAASPASPGPAGEAAASGQGTRVRGAEDPLPDGQQRDVPVPGPNRVPPASPVQWARLPRTRRVAGARRRGPALRPVAARRTGPGRRPRPPPPRSSRPGWHACATCTGCPRREPAVAPAAADLATGPGRWPRPPPPRSSGRGWRARAGCPGAPRTAARSTTGSSAANWSRAPARVSRLPSPIGEIAANAQGARVLGSPDPLFVR